MKNFEIKNNLIYFADNVPREAVDYVLDRFDNYYDANGLVDVWARTTNRSVEIVWNRSEKQPSLEEIVEQFESWYETWKSVVQGTIGGANES